VPTVRAGWSTWLEIEQVEYDRKSDPFRAPPKKIVAALWLSRGASVTLVTQQTNAYWLD
jgi:hypothetical protein